MAEVPILAAESRETIGKGPARALRRDGRIPAVIYGDGKPTIAITLEAAMLSRELKSGSFFNTLFDVQVNGEANRAVVRDVQLHPVTDRAEHVDFLRVSATTQVTVDVPVEFINEEECPGIKGGGVLNVVRYEIQVMCRPDQIPTSIVVDLASAEVGDSLHISAVTLPEGVAPTITDRDFTIATIAAPTVMAVEEETTEGEEGEEGEAATSEEGGEDSDNSGT